MTHEKTALSALSPREREIAEAYAGGASYNQIAARLCLAPTTVRTHLSTIYRKLGVSSKLALLDAVRAPAPPAAPAEGAFPPRPDRPSIAVLAFENMAGDPEQEYFADGISEDIITALSRSPWLFVIARNTTFTYKGTKVDIRRVALELGVRFVLEGSVRRVGQRVRVTAQLIDGASGGHVWSERYDGRVEDVFDLQDEITRNVVASIQTSVHLTTIAEPVERGERPDLTVWELTMRAWHLLYDFTPESFNAAEALLQRALRRDPESAVANLVLSLIHHHIAVMGFADDYGASAAAAHAFARRAVDLDGRNEYAQWAFGISCWGLGKLDASVASLRRALELNPNCSLAHGSLGTVLAMTGEIEEAIANQAIAIRSNPRDPSIFFRFSGIALAHHLAERHESAIEWAARSAHQMPRWYYAHFIAAASWMALGKPDRARAAIAACLAAAPGATLAGLDRFPLRDVARMDAIRSWLRRAGLPG